MSPKHKQMICFPNNFDSAAIITSQSTKGLYLLITDATLFSSIKIWCVNDKNRYREIFIAFKTKKFLFANHLRRKSVFETKVKCF